jgi:hypothetical protein
MTTNIPNPETNFPVWKTLKLGNLGKHCSIHDDCEMKSVCEAELDLVVINESLLNCFMRGARGLEEKVAELGLEMCPPSVASQLAVEGELPEGIGRGGIMIGHKPITQFHRGCRESHFFYHVGGRVLSSVRGNPWAGYEVSPLELQLYPISTDYSEEPTLTDESRNWVFIKPRK